MTLDKLLKLSETEPQFPHVPWEGADSQKPLHNGPSSPPGRPLLSSPSFSLLPRCFLPSLFCAPAASGHLLCVLWCLGNLAPKGTVKLRPSA